MNKAQYLVRSVLEQEIDLKKFVMGGYRGSQVLLDNEDYRVTIPADYYDLQDEMGHGAYMPTMEGFEQWTELGETVIVVRPKKQEAKWGKLPTYPTLYLFTGQPDWEGGEYDEEAKYQHTGEEGYSRWGNSGWTFVPFDNSYRIQNLFGNEVYGSIRDYFANQVRQKNEPLDNFFNLLRMGAYATASKFGKWVAFADEHDGLSSAQRLHLSAAYRKRGRPKTARFADYFKSKQVIPRDDGVQILFNDWEDLAPMFDSKEGIQLAQEVFTGEIQHPDTDPDYDASALVDSLTSEAYQQLLNRMIGYPLSDEDYSSVFPGMVIDAEGLEALQEQQSRSRVQALIHDNETLQPFRDALQWAARDVEVSHYELELMALLQAAVTSQLGEGEWVNINGMERSQLGFTVSWEKVAELMREWEDKNSEPYAGDLKQLIVDTLEFESVNPDAVDAGGWDDEEFSEAFENLLSEVPEGEHRGPPPRDDDDDERQPRLGTDVEPDESDWEQREEQMFQVFDEEHPQGRFVRMTPQEYEAYAKAFPQRVDRYKWAEFQRRREDQVEEAVARHTNRIEEAMSSARLAARHYAKDVLKNPRWAKVNTEAP